LVSSSPFLLLLIPPLLKECVFLLVFSADAEMKGGGPAWWFHFEKEQQTTIQSNIQALIQEIAERQEKAFQYAEENRRLEEERKQLEISEQHKWLPDVMLKGLLLEQNKPERLFQAARYRDCEISRW
jgi:hypothetical protein